MKELRIRLKVDGCLGYKKGDEFDVFDVGHPTKYYLKYDFNKHAWRRYFYKDGVEVVNLKVI